MPDVFDQISAPQAPAAAPKGDVFDQISSAPVAPKGDVFDQIAQPQAQGMPASERAAMDYQLAHPIGAPQMAPQPQSQMGAVRNAFTSAFHAVGDPLGNAGLRLGNRLGMVSDQQLQRAVANPLFQPDENRLSAKIGGGLGQAAAAVATGGVAAPAMFAIQGGENEREALDARQAAGEQISPWRQAADVAGQEALGYGMGKLAPGGKASKALIGATGKLANPLLNTGKNIALAAGAGAAENVGQQVGSNILTNKVGGDATRKLTEGVGGAAVAGAAFGAGGQAVHEAPHFLAQMRQNVAEKAAAPQAPTEAAKPPVMPEAVQAPKTPETAAPAPTTAASEAPTHPDRFDDVQKLTDWYNSHHPEEKTGDVIKAMTPDMPHVKANVPVDFAQGVGEDVDRSKVDSLKGLSQDERDKLPPSILGPNGDIIDGGHRIAAAKESGATHVQAYVPEDLIGQHGIEAAQPKGEAINPQAALLDAHAQVEKLKAANDPQADHAAAQLQSDLDAYGQKHGEDKMEDLIEKMQAPQPKPEQTAPRLAGGKEAGAVAIPQSLEKLAERDVRPAMLKANLDLRKSTDTANRFLGTGLNLKGKDLETATSIRESLGQQDLDKTRMEGVLKPYRDIMEKFTDKEKVHWIDQVEAIGTPPDIHTLGAANLLIKQNKINKMEGEKLGIHTDKWDENWIGRTFVFPEDEGKGTGSRSSIAGSQNFLKGRTFDTYSDALRFVESHGGRPRYNNPLDMALAKNNEVRQSIEARKLMYSQEDKGQLKWVPEGEKAPEEFGVKLKDKMAQQDRPVIAPKWMVGKLAKMEHFDAQKYMKSPEWLSKVKTLRPGEEMPEGFSGTGENTRGHFMANENVAGTFNNLISPGLTKDVPILSTIAEAKRKVVAANLGLSAVHYVLETVGNGVTSIARSMDNALHGELGLAGKNLKRALPWEMNKAGRAIREQAANPEAHPELEPLVQTSVKGGNRFNNKSILDANHFKDAQTEWGEGNKVGAGVRLLQGLYAKTHEPLFDRFIPNLRAGAKAAAAETAIHRGYSGKKMSDFMRQHQDNIDNMMGSVVRTHQFQNKIMTDMQDLIFTAPKFAEGTFRHAGATVRDTVAAVKDLASGKSPKLTPAMYTAAAGIMTHMIGAAATQMLYTTATTGKPIMPTSMKDYLAPRTGRKNDQGKEERISLLTPFSALFSAAEHGPASITGRVASIWTTGKEAITGVDRQGTMIRNPNDSYAKQGLDTAKHVGKGVLPYSVQNLMETEKPGASKTWDAKVGGFMGEKFQHTYATEAEQAAADSIYSRRSSAPITKEEGDKETLTHQLAGELRNKNPDAQKDMQQAVKDGKLTVKDLKAIAKRATEAPGLKGLLHSSELRADDIMQKVWPKMTPEQRTENQWAIRGKIGRSNLPGDEKRKYWDQIKKDVVKP